MSYLYTIGYQGRSLPDLIRELEINEIRYLVDVRANPISHRREFCKVQLRQAVEQHGINYLHARDLGSPQELRFRLRSTGDWASFFRSYEVYLQGHPGLLQSVAELLDKAPTCLICLERKPRECHRQIIARMLCLRNSNVTVRHL